MNPLIKENFRRKFFLNNFESSSEKLQKIISANVKTDAKQHEMKELTATSCNFLQEVPSKLEIHCNAGMYFSFDFA